MLIDLNECKINKYKSFGGANGSKLSIIYNNENYMMKFPPIATKNQSISYTNSCISEYISCNIIKILGFESQETYLGKYKNKIVVICKDLEENGYRLFEFAKIKNTIIDSPGYNTELSEIMQTIQEQNLIDSEKLLKFFWNMFIIDTLLGNFDRHNGNWGLLINEFTKSVKIAPIFDCGSCLFPQNNDNGMELITRDISELNTRIYSYPRSAIKENNIKINYYEFIKKNYKTNKYLEESLNKVGKAVENNFKSIENIIDNVECISEVYKKFLKTIIAKRFEVLIKQFMSKKDKSVELEWK